MRSEGVGSIDEPDSSAWLSVCGRGQCVSVWFFDVACVKTFKIQHCDSSGEHIYTKIVEEKGPGWQVCKLQCTCGAPLTNGTSYASRIML